MINNAKEKIIQFGEGGFLRGFFDWMVQKMTDAGVFDGKVVVVQPIEKGMCAALEEQGCAYNHVIRGREGVSASKIDVISRCVEPYKDWNGYIALAKQKSFEFIVSNTTEADIVFDENDKPENAPRVSFPAKLTLLFKARFDLGYPGFVLLPCELIEKNGAKLRECVLKYASLWGYGDGFIKWVKEENVFCSTLVDRINTGFPKGDPICEKFPDDKLLNVSEYYHLWVIESEKDISDRLPLKKAGLNVVFTKDKLDEYRTRKVRILNGAHTSLVSYGMLSGFETVRAFVEDEKMAAFLHRCVFSEIIPTLPGDADGLTEYAKNVLIRFDNPYINHLLRSISLNSTSKFKYRVLPSITAYKAKFGVYPPALVFGFAKLIEYYKSGEPDDDVDAVGYIKEHSVRDILSNEKLWGANIYDAELEKMIKTDMKTKYFAQSGDVL